ncbi:MAG: type II toxin-antitoxin system HicA family toxin [Puniceicoccales bacterium]|jgi:predicted RNA binding protein YcfA (HicA-like mRNA interferase family)|nr:type II toxin-antitoxin system HicA family toxin [Puniceicoccales bacterium]
MPKLPHLSGLEIVRRLGKLGFAVARQKGNHVVLRRGESGCVVPMHNEVKVGTLAGILRQSGVSTDAFLAADK